MCKKRPGPRCSDHSHQRLEKTSQRLEQQESATGELQTKLDAAKPDSKSAERYAQRLAFAKEDLERLREENAAAMLEYDATPRGQAAIKEQQAITNLEPEEKEELEDRLFLAEARREWQIRVSKKIRDLERTRGAAYAALWAQEEFRKSHTMLADIQRELASLKEEEREALAPKRRRPEHSTMHMPRRGPSRYARRLGGQRLLLALISGDLDRYVLNTFSPERLITRAAYKLLKV